MDITIWKFRWANVMNRSKGMQTQMWMHGAWTEQTLSIFKITIDISVDMNWGRSPMLALFIYPTQMRSNRTEYPGVR